MTVTRVRIPAFPGALLTTASAIATSAILRPLSLGTKRAATSDAKNRGDDGAESLKIKEGHVQQTTESNDLHKPATGTSDGGSTLRPKTVDPEDTYWEDHKPASIQTFDDLPSRLFGFNQHLIIDHELKEVLRLLLRQFNAPVVYAFAYGSGVFPQSSVSHSLSESAFRAVHPHPPQALLRAQRGAPKMVDFIFGVTHTQHWHSINMRQHPEHYSALAWLGSAAVSRVQERWGAGVYFHPYVVVDGVLVKYGVTSIDNLVQDLSTWDNLYLAGRLHKPVKILRDHARVRLANQHNLLAALRTALLLLPERFTERDLYAAIAGLSYLGDPRMALPTENPSKVSNIVDHNRGHFRRLYAPLITMLPNVDFADTATALADENWVMDPTADHRMTQDMEPIRRGNMVRRLPERFRARLYYRYQRKYGMRTGAADEDVATGRVSRREGGWFEKRIVGQGNETQTDELIDMVRRAIRQTVAWPSTTQSLKGPLTAGIARTLRYLREKVGKWWEGRRKAEESNDKD